MAIEAATMVKTFNNHPATTRKRRIIQNSIKSNKKFNNSDINNSDIHNESNNDDGAVVVEKKEQLGHDVKSGGYQCTGGVGQSSKQNLNNIKCASTNNTIEKKKSRISPSDVIKIRDYKCDGEQRINKELFADQVPSGSTAVLKAQKQIRSEVANSSIKTRNNNDSDIKIERQTEDSKPLVNKTTQKGGKPDGSKHHRLIVNESDRYLVTDLVYSVFCQYRPICNNNYKNSINKGERGDGDDSKKVGLECIHCRGDSKKSYTLYPGTNKRLGKSMLTPLRDHVENDCKYIPDKIKSMLDQFSEKQNRQYTSCPATGQVEFLSNVWNRLQKYKDIATDDDNENKNKAGIPEKERLKNNGSCIEKLRPPPRHRLMIAPPSEQQIQQQQQQQQPKQEKQQKKQEQVTPPASGQQPIPSETIQQIDKSSTILSKNGVIIKQNNTDVGSRQILNDLPVSVPNKESQAATVTPLTPMPTKSSVAVTQVNNSTVQTIDISKNDATNTNLISPEPKKKLMPLPNKLPTETISTKSPAQPTNAKITTHTVGCNNISKATTIETSKYSTIQPRSFSNEQLIVGEKSSSKPPPPPTTKLHTTNHVATAQVVWAIQPTESAPNNQPQPQVGAKQSPNKKAKVDTKPPATMTEECYLNRVEKKVPLKVLMTDNLSQAMIKSEMSQKRIQEWDTKQGLRRCHSTVMLRSSKSRDQLQLGIVCSSTEEMIDEINKLKKEWDKIEAKGYRDCISRYSFVHGPKEKKPKIKPQDTSTAKKAPVVKAATDTAGVGQPVIDSKTSSNTIQLPPAVKRQGVARDISAAIGKSQIRVINILASKAQVASMNSQAHISTVKSQIPAPSPSINSQLSATAKTKANGDTVCINKGKTVDLLTGSRNNQEVLAIEEDQELHFIDDPDNTFLSYIFQEDGSYHVWFGKNNFVGKFTVLQIAELARRLVDECLYKHRYDFKTAKEIALDTIDSHVKEDRPEKDSDLNEKEIDISEMIMKSLLRRLRKKNSAIDAALKEDEDALSQLQLTNISVHDSNEHKNGELTEDSLQVKEGNLTLPNEGKEQETVEKGEIERQRT